MLSTLKLALVNVKVRYIFAKFIYLWFDIFNVEIPFLVPVLVLRKLGVVCLSFHEERQFFIVPGQKSLIDDDNFSHHIRTHTHNDDDNVYKGSCIHTPCH